MNTLDQIFIETGADKASKHPHLAHNYAVHYERYFASLRFDKVKLLEIGVGSGCSVEGWLKYFELGLVWGLDIIHDTNDWNTPGTKGPYTFIKANQSDEIMWKCFEADYGKDFDIIIDDGSHMNSDVFKSFECAWPLVRSGGFYCIEDLAVGDDSTSVFVLPKHPRHLDWIRDLLIKVNRGQIDIRSLHYSKELAIIQKA